MPELGNGVIVKLCPGLEPDVALAWGGALSMAADEFGIDTHTRQAMWLANLLYESRGLTKLEEDLSYSATRLSQVWPSRYAISGQAKLGPNTLALSLAYKPESIANDCYADRMGNGPAYTGDGWHFRGRYPPQLTGRNNYTACQAAIGVPDLLHPERLLTDIAGMARVSGWFWHVNKLGPIADRGNLETVVRKWVGGPTDSIGRRADIYKDAMLAKGMA